MARRKKLALVTGGAGFIGSNLARELQRRRWKGRIIDKLTPGQRDGFLLDCHPGLSLRAIGGPDEQVHQGVLSADTWHHVVLVILHSSLRQ